MYTIQLAAEADLPSLVSNAAVAAPPHRLVEGDALAIAGNGPQYRGAIAVLDQMAVSDCDERAADSGTPVRLIDEYAVQLAERGINRIAARADFDASDDRARAFGNPQTVRDRPGETPPPAPKQFRRHGPIRSRQQLSERGIPGFDVDARDDLRVNSRRRSDEEP